ncbi:MAG TPA: FISUMP domain-containing protein, partial [Chitinophagales bacterium]|nr:FISUMP domain-containing protein [Chitinophagales bacterium]
MKANIKFIIGFLICGISIYSCQPDSLLLADFTVSTTNITVGTSVNFTDISTGSPTSWQWDFGDGTTSSIQNPNKIYTVAGTYTVTLTISKPNGTGSKQKSVVVAPALTADFMASNRYITIGTSIDYTDLSIGNPTSWSWTFQGGTPATSTVQNPTGIQYNTAGNHTVTLTVTDASGNSTETKPSYIVAIFPNCGTVNDIDGNTYNTVTIGTQCWMTENLKTSTYNDGTAILNETINTQWVNLTTGAYCYYNNNISNKATYGTLYNWYAVNTGKLAPSGWHVPTEADWTTLINYLGGETVAGGKMKAITLWNSPNTAADNSSGFSGLPAGIRTQSGTYFDMGNEGNFWSATEV